MAKPASALSLADLCLDSGSEQQAQINRIVDEHVQWLLAFHRLAFYSDVATSAAAAIDGRGGAADLPMPKSFASWFRGAAQRLPAEQSVIDRLAILHDQLHKFAKMMLQKAEGGKKTAAMPAIDYEMVMTRYADFMQALRRFERGFSAASAGLDLLTGLRSRFTLATDLAAEQKRMARSKEPGGQPLSIAIGDIDRFRDIGALHGVETADRALVQMGEAVQQAIRTYDDAYRVEGDIFLICLKGAIGADAAAVIERLRGRVADAPVRLFGGGTLQVTAAFGVVETRADEPLPDLLARLEATLRGAKESGGNRVAFTA